MTPDRDTILARVKDALAPLPRRAPLPDWESELVVMRQARGVVDPWTLFAERLRGVNGTPLTAVAELVALLDRGGWRRGYCDPQLWPRLAPAFPAGFAVETAFDRARVDDFSFGITRATAAIAETGTLVLTDTGTTSRLAALAPWVHVAVLTRADIFIDVPQAVAALPKDPNVIWVTGPSKTADVEGILIEGVHGPGVQVALLAD
ncbi:MAG TPA: LUD domain-containing protein [Lacunisphaera sp.]|nr:LUD domain-containing protein [Lacunisphaera sp.]